MKKYNYLFMALILLMGYNDAAAQRTRTRERETPTERNTPKERSSTERKTRTKEKPEPFNLMDKLNPEIKIGNLGFSSSFAISFKPSIGYKLTDRFSAGTGVRGLYQFINVANADDVSYFDYGIFGYGRAKIVNGLYLQAEYSTYSLDGDFARSNFTYPLFGGGYLNEGEKWSYGAELLFIGDEKARDSFGSVIEWWFSFSYNF